MNRFEQRAPRRGLEPELNSRSAVMTPDEDDIMRTKSRAVAHKLIGRTAIAAGIGGALSLSLVLREVDIFRMAADGASQDGATLLVTLSLACIFAIGAGIMGVTSLLSDEQS